jgi:alkylation response protein AidB-like acyl-CoA dehydrogenase
MTGVYHGEVAGLTGLATRAADAAVTAGRHAQEADRERVLSPQVVKAMVSAGFARHFVPRRFGGAEGSVAELLAAVATVGEECVSAAWCAALTAGAARMGAFLPEQGQAELWADGPDAVIAGALVPAGQPRPARGGWRLTGQWAFTSGADHANWALVAAPLPHGDTVKPHFFAVARDQFTVRDTWHNVGMRGTGSNTLVLDDVFVPQHRLFDREQLILGRPVASAAACHTAPLRALSGILFAAPALGGAQGAQRAWIAHAGARAGAAAVARTAGEIEMAALLLRRVAASCDAGAVSPTDLVRNPYDCALVADTLVTAVERMFRAAGSRGQLATEPLQRFWRDLHCLASHVALRLEPTGAGYGKHLLSDA